MNALIVGGDNLGNIPYKLHQKGFNTIEHISGRKGRDKKASILMKLERADLIIVFVDFVSHGVMKNTKEKIRNLNANAIYTKRSWSHLEDYLEKINVGRTNMGKTNI